MRSGRGRIRARSILLQRPLALFFVLARGRVSTLRARVVDALSCTHKVRRTLHGELACFIGLWGRVSATLVALGT